MIESPVIETIDGSGAPLPELGSDILGMYPKRPKSERPQAARLDATYTLSVFSTHVKWRNAAGDGDSP